MRTATRMSRRDGRGFVARGIAAAVIAAAMVTSQFHTCAANAADWPLANITFSGSAPPNDFGTYNAPSGPNEYHTGMDVRGVPTPCNYDTPVVAGVTGSVAQIFRVSDCGPEPADHCHKDGCPDHGLGNTVIVQGNDGYYYQYSHLESITVTLSQQVTPSTQIGVMGNSGAGVQRRGSCNNPACPTPGDNFGPHLHFEVKTAPVICAPAAPRAGFADYNDLPTSRGAHH